MQQQDFLETGGRRLAYVKTPGREPGVMFLTGFKSDMTGSKALALEEFCRERGQAYLRFDYTGHGQSSGEFEEGCIGAWLQDACDAFDRLTQGPQIIVGSSMGGWIALLLALSRKERVAGLVGIAAAPDFTEELVWQAFTPAQQRELMEKDRVAVPNCYEGDPYIITKQLVEEGRNHLLLQDKIPIVCPVRLLHGTKDEDVPWQVSARLLEKLESADARLTLIKDAGHRLSEPEQLELLCEAVEEVVSLPSMAQT